MKGGTGRKAGKMSGLLALSSPAKVNLLLRVVGRRSDGYHDLETVMTALDLSDTVVLERLEKGGITLDVDGADVPAGPENLAWKAARAFFEALDVEGSVRIGLIKRIPPGGGLGGGSSNAAAVLLGLNRLFGTGLDLRALETLAGGVGSDVAFFLRGGTSLCRGRGEQVEPLEDPGPLFFVLLLPPFPCPTGEVYRFFRPGDSSSEEVFRDSLERMRDPGSDPAGWILNDLEAPARRAVPELDRFMGELESLGLEGFRVSGSGSTLFRAFREKGEARRELEKARSLLEGKGVGLVLAGKAGP